MQKKKIKLQVAQALLEIGAIGFTPENPIQFKSGLISPVYIDNRRLPFNPKQWHLIITSFSELAQEKNIPFDVIAGIESAGIPHSAALGFLLQKPSVFTRKATKDHGTKKMVEGGDVSGKRVLLIEDHVTTGSSSLLGVTALRNERAVVTDCFSITSYGFDTAEKAFRQAKVVLHTLTDFTTILQQARNVNILNKKQVETITDWFQHPQTWAKKYGFSEQ